MQDKNTPSAVGIDLGAVFTRIAGVNPGGEVGVKAARRHQGRPVETLKALLTEHPLPGTPKLGVTGRSASLLCAAAEEKNLFVDAIEADIVAVKRQFPDVRNIINVGGASVTLIRLDEHGQFLDYTANSLCAAGTGSFLDQQAERMELTETDLAEFDYTDEPPSIATRCSVFAKSDLIHRQQEGYSKPALWAGLCRGMTRTFLNTLLRGQQLEGLTVLTGGVALNREVLRALHGFYGEQVQTWSEADYSCAVGAALLAAESTVSPAALAVTALQQATGTAGVSHRSPLRLKKSTYPSFEVAESYVDEHGNEVRITDWPDGQPRSGYMGIDVGSTSTKLLLMDDQEKVVADIYRRTRGEPIRATQLLLQALSDLEARKGAKLTVLGMATTGSGRKLVGKVFSADTIVNEITAHLTGALHVDDRLETIFEIGGQDSKYIRADDGRIRDSNMNYVCAAGTGSFVEEVAGKLGFGLEEIGKVVMGVSPPTTSDRCTVFMEQDVDQLIRQGFSREECMAAVLYSVVKNYLNKVVGRRTVCKDRIFFQGATARNPGLVAAFENLLNIEVVVSPYCHVMGSYGAALLVKRELASADRPTKFSGIEVGKRQVELHSETCKLCENRCKITFAHVEGQKERPSWGYLCGRDPEEKRVRVRHEFEHYRRRARMTFEKDASSSPPTAPRAVIGIPRALTHYSYLPFWRTLLETLGCRVKLSGRTEKDTITKGAQITGAEFCFPVKIAHGHARALASDKKVDWILIPHMVCPGKNPATTNSFFCPYVQAQPSILKAAFELNGLPADKIIAPIFDLRQNRRQIIRDLHDALGEPLGVSLSQIGTAWTKARRVQARFETACLDVGEKALAEIKQEGKKGVVILGRPYNSLDFGANLALPEKIADLGFPVLPVDVLPMDLEKISPVFRNMYWAYGQRILQAAQKVRDREDLFAIYLTNFSCGPDSFLLSHVEEIMGDKPFLILEMDEHGGDAGYMTRVEAFFDVIRSWRPKPGRVHKGPAGLTEAKLQDKTLWVPPMHGFGARIFAAAMKGFGMKAEALPLEDREAFEIGRSLTRGSECLPAACTIGALVKKLREQGTDDGAEHAFFMPSADGPCRFGQYGLLQRNILNRLGLGGVDIISPSCYNSYHGLAQPLRQMLWKGILVGDILNKCGCRVRPYEAAPGATDAALEEATCRMEHAFSHRGDLEAELGKAVESIAAVKRNGEKTRPLVGVVGEIYVRCNEFTNDDVVRTIERLGGEAWLAPVSEWILYTAFMQQWNSSRHWFNFFKRLKAWLKNSFLYHNEERYYAVAGELLAERHEPTIADIMAAGERYLPRNFYGESILTLGRAYHFARGGAALIVNAAPFSCMPGTLTSALSQKIQVETQVPIVSMFYDGEAGLNDRLAVYLNNLGVK